MARLLVMGVLSLILISCTRKVEETSKVSIGLPSTSVKTKTAGGYSEQAVTEVLSHVVINVSGPGMNHFIYNWDSHDVAQVPGQFEFEFVQGSGRLIQVLAVYSDPDTKAMNFYYGDTVADFSTSSVSLYIQVTNLINSMTASGRLSGRYLYSDGNGPTGGVDITYAPPGGKPDMIIEHSYVYNGWFNFFGLSDVPLTYRLYGGAPLFGGAIKLRDLASGPQVAKFQVPIHKRIEGGIEKTGEPALVVWGWFGDSTQVAAKSICIPAPNPNLTNLKKFLSSANGLSMAHTTGLESTLSMYDSVTTNALGYLGEARYLGGRIPSDGTPYTSSCSGGGTEYGTKLTINMLQFEKARDNGALVLGPMLNQNITEGGPFNASGNTWTGQLLPGVDAAVNAVRFYVIPSNLAMAYQNIDSGNFPCNSLPPEVYFYDLNVGAAQFSMNFGNLPPEQLMQLTSAPKASIGICFVKDGVPYPIGFLHRGESGGSSGPRLKIEFQSVNFEQDTYDLLVGKCHPVNAKVYQNSSLMASFSGSFNVASGAGFYTDAACTNVNAFSGTVTLSAGVQSTPGALYFKQTTELVNPVNLNGVTTPMGLEWSPSYNKIRASKPILSFSLPSSGVYQVNGCYPLAFYLKTASGQSASFDGATSFDLQIPSGFSVHTDSACSTAGIANFSFAGAISESSPFYLKPTSAVAASAFGITGTNLGLVNTATVQVASVATLSSQDAVNVSIERLDSMTRLDQCQMVKVTLRNKDGQVVQAPSAGVNISVRLDNAQAQFWWNTSSGCMSAPTTVVVFAVGESTRVGYMKISSLDNSIALGGTADVRWLANVGGGASETIAGGPFTVSPPASGLYLYLSSDFTADQRQALYIGDHDFAAGKVRVPIKHSSGYYLSCSADAGATWTADCASRIVTVSGTKYFTFLAADTANVFWQFRLKISQYADGSGYTTMTQFNLAQFLNPSVNIVNCQSVISSSGTSELLNNALNGVSAGQAVCLGSNVTLTFNPGATPSQQITNLTGRKVIGSFDRTAKISQVSGTTGQIFMVGTGDAWGSVVANLHLDQSLSSAASSAMFLSPSTGLLVVSSNNRYTANASSGFSIRVSASGQVQSKNDLFENLSEKPFQLYQPMSGEVFVLEGAKILPASSGSIPFVFYVDPNTTGFSSIRVEHSKVLGKAGILADANPTGCSGCGIMLSVFDSVLDGTGGTGVGMVLHQSTAPLELHFERSKIVSRLGGPLVHVDKTYGGTLNLNNWRNVYVDHSASAPLILRTATGAAYTPITFAGTWSDVHFVRTGGSAQNLVSVSEATGMDGTSLNNSVHYCATSGNMWSLNSNISGSPWNTISIMANVDSQNSRCF